MRLRIQGIDSEEFETLRAGGADANGQTPVRRSAEGGANPCRHCLGLIPEGEPLLVLGYRPFAEAQPYAETGPVFLHAERCPHYDSDQLPSWFTRLDPAAVRGYDSRDWIRYETGQIVRGGDIRAACATILANPEVAYVHVRSKFGCFQCRVERG